MGVFDRKVKNLKNKKNTQTNTHSDNIEPEESVNSLHHFEMANFGKPTICDVCRKLLRLEGSGGEAEAWGGGRMGVG